MTWLLTVSYAVIIFLNALKVSTIHKQCLLNLTGDHNVNDNEPPTEDIEITVRTEVRHEPDIVTQTYPSHGACSDDGIQASNSGTSTLTPANDSTVQRTTPQYGCGQGVKRMRFTEQEPTVRPSTSRIRNTDNNGTY